MRKLNLIIAMLMMAAAVSTTSCEQSEIEDLSPALDMPEVQMTNGNAHADPNRPPRPGGN